MRVAGISRSSSNVMAEPSVDTPKKSIAFEAMGEKVVELKPPNFDDWPDGFKRMYVMSRQADLREAAEPGILERFGTRIGESTEYISERPSLASQLPESITKQYGIGQLAESAVSALDSLMRVGEYAVGVPAAIGGQAVEELGGTTTEGRKMERDLNILGLVAPVLIPGKVGPSLRKIERSTRPSQAKKIGEKPDVEDVVSEEFVVQPGQFRQQTAQEQLATELGIFETRLPSESLMKKINAVFLDLLEAGKVPRDTSGTLTVTEQVANALETARISPKVYENILKRHGVTGDLKKEMTRLYGESRSVYGRGLATQSALKRGIERLDAATEGIEPGYIASPTGWARWRGLTLGAMVSNIYTATRNATVGVARVPMDTLARNVQLGLQRATGKFDPANPMQTPMDAWGLLINSMRPIKSRKMVNDLLKIRPKQYDELMRTYSADVKLGRQKLPERVIYALNVFNRAQDQFFRSFVFADGIERRLRAKNLDPATVMREGSLKQHVSKDMLEASIKEAMEFTFSGRPKGETAKSFVKLLSRPGFDIAIPFPNFLAASMKFTTEYSPAGPLYLLSKAERARIAKGDYQALGRYAAGTATFGAVYAARQSKYAGERWYEFITNPDAPVEDRNYIDVRAYYPLAAHAYVADLYQKLSDGRLWNMNWKDLAQGISGAQVRGGTGLYAVDAMARDLQETKSPQDKTFKIIKRLLGEYTSRILVPLNQIKNVYSEFDPEEGVIRDTGQSPLTGPWIDKIPGLSQTLPEVVSPLEEGPLRRAGTGIRVATGVTVRRPKTNLIQQLDKLDMRRKDVLGRTGNEELDRLMAAKVRPVVTTLYDKLDATKLWQSLPEDRWANGLKRMVLKEAFKQVRSGAWSEIRQERPDLFTERYIRRQPKELRAILRATGQTPKSVGADVRQRQLQRLPQVPMGQ
jgi:hypothetical protein